MKGKIEIETEGGTHEVELTNKDIKMLKRMMSDIEGAICVSHCMSPNIREVQAKDPRLKTLYKILDGV